MTALNFAVFDLDFPVGSRNKTATLITGETDALLVDAAFTRADGHRLAAAVLDSGKTLTTVFISHADPDFYFGAEVIADAFPEVEFLAPPDVIEHIEHSYEGKLQAWAHLGETEKAIETIQMALRLTPDNAQLAFEASVVYVVIGDRGSALFHARRAAEAGLDPRWFAFSWFDPLRSDPAFPSSAVKR